MAYFFSDSFEFTIKNTYGPAGVTWLTQLPIIIEQCATLWKLTHLHPFANLTYNYVLSGMQDGIPVVLKLRCAVAELRKEVAALTTFQDHGCVKLLDHDEQLSALLIEQIIPGNTLSLYLPNDDSNATHIAADLVKMLHDTNISSTYNFPSLEVVLPDLSKNFSELMLFLTRARELRKSLLATQHNKVLLHGDFHHGNILLTSNNQWLVIDPEGIIGDPIYDLAIYIRNPLKEMIVLPHAQEIVTNRIHDFATLLGYSPQRIYDWTYLQAVCSAYWSLEDGLTVSHHVKFLDILNDIRSMT